MPNNLQILLVGCGKMGGAILSGWLKSGMNPANITVISPTKCELEGVSSYADIDQLPVQYAPKIIVFAIKPQLMNGVLEPYKKFVQNKAVFISIAAGKNIGFFENILGNEAQIIRSMPNLPAVIAKGVTVMVANKNTTQADQNIAQTLLESIGDVRWLDDESLMDAVTAISGSGPAYLFYFVESLINAGKNLGLSEELATDLAVLTVSGSSKLLRDREVSIAQLRTNVTSKKGATSAALDILMGGEFEEILCKAVVANKNRCSELS